jgi:hypothetical protein
MAHEIDWPLLAELRARYLSPEPTVVPDYWHSAHVLDQYDRTFAQRIGWKWDSVLTEVVPRLAALRALRPAVVDWGCGTGIASRRFLAAWGATSVEDVALYDRSESAQNFGRERLQAEFPQGAVHAFRDVPASPFILLVSHVLSELGSSIPNSLNALVERASAIIWLEPGTPRTARELVKFREQVSPRFQWVAPCPHAGPCGLFGTDGGDWCHHFATPPGFVFQDRFWGQFSKEMGIDLRSLPVSYLVGVEKSIGASPRPIDNRIIGRVRPYKGYIKALVCDENGVEEKRLLERNDKALVKRLKAGGFSLSISNK